MVAIGVDATEPYRGGESGIPVQWLFEGVTELLPIHDPLEDGAEIMWAELPSVELARLRLRAKSLEELRQHLDKDAH